MSQHFHMCLDISGGLRNLKQLSKYMTDDEGNPMTAWEIKAYLLGEQAKGYKVVPTCECDNFDYQHGCQGHEEEPDPQ